MHFMLMSTWVKIFKQYLIKCGWCNGILECFLWYQAAEVFWCKSVWIKIHFNVCKCFESFSFPALHGLLDHQLQPVIPHTSPPVLPVYSSFSSRCLLKGLLTLQIWTRRNEFTWVDVVDIDGLDSEGLDNHRWILSSLSWAVLVCKQQ